MNMKARPPLYNYNQIMYRLRLYHPHITQAFGLRSTEPR